MTKRIGMIGAGWVTRHHLDAYRALADRATVVAIADPSADAGVSRAGEYGIARVYADAGDMISSEQLDAIDVASPREFHAEHVRLAARANIAVLCQKPLASSFSEAWALVAEIGTQVPFMVHENWRFRPHYRLIRRWLDDDRIGAPVQVAMCVLTSGLIPDAVGRLPALVRQPMFATLEQLLVKELLIHHVDTLRYLLGELRLLSASVGRLSDAVTGDDHALLAMATNSHTPVVLTGNLCAHGYPSEAFDRLEIFGERGRILLERDRLILDAARPEEIALDLAANYSASYRGAISCFLDGLAAGRMSENRPADNLEVLRIVDEAYTIGAKG